MFTFPVKNLYLGKSKLDFLFQETPIPPTTLIGDIGIPLNSLKKVSLFLPDYYIPIKVIDIPLVEIGEPDSFLCITGVPKRQSLEPYKIKKTLWTSLYEDNHRGYLFQIIPMLEPLELKFPSDIKVNLHYEHSRIH